MAQPVNIQSIVASAQSNVNELLGQNKKIDAAFSTAAATIKTMLPPNAAVHVSKELLAALLFVQVLSVLMFLGLTKLLVDVAAFVYPAYKVAVSLEYPYDSEKRKKSKVQWLSYLMIFCLLQIVEAYALFLLLKIPLYHLIKFASLAWLYSPITKGSITAYESLIKVYVLPHIHELDNSTWSLKITRTSGGTTSATRAVDATWADVASSALAASGTPAATSSSSGSPKGKKAPGGAQSTGAAAAAGGEVKVRVSTVIVAVASVKVSLLYSYLSYV